jgi:propionyl-CoA synthetase
MTPGSRLSGLHHVGLTVGDMERSLAFYTGLLGLRVADRGTWSGPEADELVGRPGVELDCADVELGQGRLLELVERTDGASLPPVNDRTHFAVVVDDVHAVHERLVAAGVAVRGKPVTLKQDAGPLWVGMTAMYTTDPDGFTVEVMQLPDDRPTMSYDSVYREWAEDPQGFWAQRAEGIDWDRRWDALFDDEDAPLCRWFPGGRLNTAFNALNRRFAAGRGEQAALIWDSPVTGSKRTYSYAELLDLVARFAGALAAEGVAAGDRVVIYMPMVPEAIVAMLACARVGAVHSVVFGGFAADELATRIADCGAKLVVTASCGLEPGRIVEYGPIVDAALASLEQPPRRCIVLQREQHPVALVPGRDVDFHAALASAEPVAPVPVAATDPLYVLYTSGTTGLPKGVVRDNGGHAVALHYSMEAVYDVRPGDVFWAASDIGWVVGHSYIVYAPLLYGCTTVLYEGKPVGTPDAGAFWRVCAEHGVTTLFTAPTAIRAIRREDSDGVLMAQHDLSKLRALFLAGERCDPDTLTWARERLDRPVIDHWWQTETGWPIVANCLGIEPLPVKPGSPTRAVPGYRVEVLDDDGASLPPGEVGEICLRLPLPPGCTPMLWKGAERFAAEYLTRFPGCYRTGDAGFLDEDGYLFVMSRTDDVINVAAHRLSTGAIEEILASHPDVAECCCVGVADQLKGQVPVGFAVLKAGAERPHAEVVAELVALVRERLGPVASFKAATVVRALPKTRSGKILRGTIRRMIDGEPWQAPPTIEDPAVLDELSAQLGTR